MQRALEFVPPLSAAQPSLGWQTLIDLHDCETPHLDDVTWVRAAMLEAAVRAEATIVGERFHRFEPHGISGVVMIGESHLAVHIWPERKFAAIDVFTCNSALKTKAAAAYLTNMFAATCAKTLCFKRGEDTGEAVTDSATVPPGVVAMGPETGAGCDELYIDTDTESEGHWFVSRGTIAQRQTAFQKAEIVDLAAYGKALVLDGDMQSFESDEYMYHEALVQPAMCLHAAPRRVLIIGGGEGAVAREVLKHRNVERAVMVDIDGEVVALAREHLAGWHCGAFDDPRLSLIVGDGHAFVQSATEQFDVVVIDLVSSFDGGPAEALYTRDFYRCLKSRLSPGGVLVIQSMECHAGTWRDHARVRNNLAGLFAHMRSYQLFVPSYGCPWGFVIVSDEADPQAALPSAIDGVIEARGLREGLRFYDGRTHQGLFALPKDLRLLLGAA
jgi:spermidine synthase